MSRPIIESPTDRPGRFRALVDANRRERNLLRDFYEPADLEGSTVAASRRRRRALSGPQTPIKTVALVEEDGVLYWRDGIPARPPLSPSGRRRRAAGGAPVSVVLTREFPALAPNKVIAAIGAIDRRLNRSIDALLRGRLRPLRQTAAGTFELGDRDVAGPFSGRTLLFVHGTFSNAASMLGEFTEPDAPGLRFLAHATRGSGRYDQVLFFDHPTLSVSPVINALELGRALGASTGRIDVIAHSRGGLVVRWWLEAFGSALGGTAASRIRVVLVGSPLRGTSLAAPDKLQNATSLLSNVGTLAEQTLGLRESANPFLWVGGKLVEVVVSVAGSLARTPVVDAFTALVPGLAGQSAVDNNHEINRLRTGPAAVEPAYYAVVSNFETPNPGWRFWRNFRKGRLGDLAADWIFPGDNDLVVDTASMTDFGVPRLRLAGPACDFGTSAVVWHCNYFRQPRTVDYLATKLGVRLD